MKILIGSMPATGHVNPMLAIARILMTDGHEVAIYTGSAFRAPSKLPARSSFRCRLTRISIRQIRSREFQN
jgi:hypothetical protein